MDSVLLFFVWAYFIGCVVSAVVYPRRAGMDTGAWLVAFMHPGSKRNGIPWVLMTVIKVISWPIVLGIWLNQGRPPSPVLFGPAAALMLYGDAERYQPGFLTKWTAPSRG